ncbi:MAG: PleD family two-component system response regulator [Phenylobacterium sp.]
MTARVFLVDDVEDSRRALEAKLAAEYYRVVSASEGSGALEAITADPPDVVLLDLLSPSMEGLEICRRLKADEDLKHIPVILLTELDGLETRLIGLEAGADEFLTKPLDDAVLFARLSCLARLKGRIDTWRELEGAVQRLGMRPLPGSRLGASGGRILLIDDDGGVTTPLFEALSVEHRPVIETDAAKALQSARGPIDLTIINLGGQSFDALRLLGALRAVDHSRRAPILAVVDPEDTDRLSKALDLGIDDLLFPPFDPLELRDRARALIRRKRYADYLQAALSQTLELAVTDPLTGLNNRRYMMGQLDALFERYALGGEPVSLLMLDVDFFKQVNDAHGHATGDAVLREVALRLASAVRAMDLPCRYGGEEFVVVMPSTSPTDATRVAERIRTAIASKPFELGEQSLPISVSVGVSASQGEGDRPESLLRRADEALYEAKATGRNQVIVRV